MGKCANCGKTVLSFTYVNERNPALSWCEKCFENPHLSSPYFARDKQGRLIVQDKAKKFRKTLSEQERNAHFKRWGANREVRYNLSAQQIYENITGATDVTDTLDEARRLSISAESSASGKITGVGMAKEYVMKLLSDELEPLRKEVWSAVLQLAPSLVKKFVAQAAPVLGTALQVRTLVTAIQEWYNASSMKTTTEHIAFSLPKNENVQMFCGPVGQLCEILKRKAQIDTARESVVLLTKVVSEVVSAGAAAIAGTVASVANAIASLTILVYNIAKDLSVMKKMNELLADCSIDSFTRSPWLAAFALSDVGPGLASSTMLGLDISMSAELNSDNQKQIENEMKTFNRLVSVAREIVGSTHLKLVAKGSGKLEFSVLDDSIKIIGASYALSTVQDACSA